MAEPLTLNPEGLGLRVRVEGPLFSRAETMDPTVLEMLVPGLASGFGILDLVAEFISPKKVYTSSCIVGNIIPKSVK